MARTLAVVALTATLAVATTASAAPGDAPEPFLRDLAFPTNMAFAPDGRLFFTEKQTGNVRIVRDGRLLGRPFATLPVVPDAERGLLGIAIGPDFSEDPWVHLYLSDAADGVNRLIRVPARGDRGGDPEVLLEGLDSAAGYHNGGDLVFGPDGTLFASLGEAHDPDRAQDPQDLGGTIVRLGADGSVPAGAPFGRGNPVWSYGHRNSFGLCVDPSTGALWATENGPDVDDEVNLIERGGNYGWPLVTGRGGGADLEQPVTVFRDPIALTGCAVAGGDLYFGSFDGRVWRLPAGGPDRRTPEEIATLPSGVTDVALGPDGLLYVATSDAIWTMTPLGTAPSPSPSPPASDAPAPPDPGDEGDERGANRWIAIVAAIALAVGLGVRFAAGRRLRQERGRLR